MCKLLHKSMTPFCVCCHTTDVSEAYGDTCQGKQEDSHITSDHVLLGEENMVFKWAIVCAMSIWLLGESRNLSQK